MNNNEYYIPTEEDLQDLEQYIEEMEFWERIAMEQAKFNI